MRVAPYRLGIVQTSERHLPSPGWPAPPSDRTAAGCQEQEQERVPEIQEHDRPSLVLEGHGITGSGVKHRRGYPRATKGSVHPRKTHHRGHGVEQQKGHPQLGPMPPVSRAVAPAATIRVAVATGRRQQAPAQACASQAVAREGQQDAQGRVTERKDGVAPHALGGAAGACPSSG